jgi:DNA polymerase-1
MVRLPAALKAAGLTARLLLQVHDELLFEAPEDEAAETAAVARAVMEAAAHLSAAPGGDGHGEELGRGRTERRRPPALCQGRDMSVTATGRSG